MDFPCLLLRQRRPKHFVDALRIDRVGKLGLESRSESDEVAEKRVLRVTVRSMVGESQEPALMIEHDKHILRGLLAGSLVSPYACRRRAAMTRRARTVAAEARQANVEGSGD